jgi:Ca-activated chloride channel homolog
MLDLASITFHWPAMLWLLACAPLLALLYLRLAARRKIAAMRYASLETVGEAAGGDSAFRRFFPATLLLLGLCAMLLAVARPHAVVMVPSRMETVILAMDVSGSMRATDLKPSRIAAAQSAAKAFVAKQPGHVRIGIVSIAGTAALAQSPTRNREDIVQAIDRFHVQPGTALGSGLAVSLATLLPDSGIDVEQIIHGSSSRRRGYNPWKAQTEPFKPVPPGSYGSAAIVMLSDGQSNVGPEPLKVANMAAERGVRIYTVGMGTSEGATLSVNGWSMRVRLEEDALKKIATVTRGEYFRADAAGELTKIYQELSTRLAIDKHRVTEVTALFAGIGAGLAMLAAVLSLMWFNRIL